MSGLTGEQVEILEHTTYRAAGGFYCGDSPAVQALVEAGLMEPAGRKGFVPDPYFSITGAGRRVLREALQARPRWPGGEGSCGNP